LTTQLWFRRSAIAVIVVLAAVAAHGVGGSLAIAGIPVGCDFNECFDFSVDSCEHVSEVEEVHFILDRECYGSCENGSVWEMDCGA